RHVVAGRDGEADPAQGRHADPVEGIGPGDLIGNDGRRHGTFIPAVTLSVPRTTSRSPAPTPASTCTWSRPVTASRTGGCTALPSRTSQTESLPAALNTAAAGTVTASRTERTCRWVTAFMPGRGVGASRPSSYLPPASLSRAREETPPRADVRAGTAVESTVAS